MSKKWKNKLKQQKSRIVQNAKIAPTEKAEEKVTSPTAQEAREVQKQEKIITSDKKLLPETKLVRREVLKIALIIVILFVVLAVAVVTDAKYSWVIESADIIGKELKEF